MTEYRILPDGWPQKLSDGFAGHFMYEGQLCFKSEYNLDDKGRPQAFNSSGEMFCADDDVMVQPVVMEDFDND